MILRSASSPVLILEVPGVDRVDLKVLAFVRGSRRSSRGFLLAYLELYK